MFPVLWKKLSTHPMPDADTQFMRLALRLARRGYGTTSPNPMVGAVLVQGKRIIGRGWHHRAGLPHAEIEALRDAQRHGHDPRGATLYVTLEPCCTHGRTPPCTDAIKAAGIKRIVVGAIDPNPQHSGRAFKILRNARKQVVHGVLAEECAALNEAFNHWMVHRTPFVTVKAAMTLDGKIATVSGESKWITGERARAYGMHLRQGSDAILAGINTILADDPSLTFRPTKIGHRHCLLRRIVLDSMARTPLTAKVVSDEHAALTTIVVSKSAPKQRIAALARHVRVLIAPSVPNPHESTSIGGRFSLSSGERAGVRASVITSQDGKLGHYPQIDLRWLLKKLGRENVTSLLVEGGGEVNASFLLGHHAHRVVFFYAPKIFGGRDARKAVAGEGVFSVDDALKLTDVEWGIVGQDLLLRARVASDK